MLEKYRETAHNRSYMKKKSKGTPDMKKLIAVILILLLSLNLCACSGGSGKKNAATGSDLSWEQIEKLAEKELAKEAAEG